MAGLRMIHKSQDCHYRTVFVRAPTEQIWQKSFQTGASSLDLPLYIIFLHRLCCSLCWLPNSPSVEANWPLVPLGLYSISLAAPVEKEFLLIATVSLGWGGGRDQPRLARFGPHAQLNVFISGAKPYNQSMKYKVDPDKSAESRGGAVPKRKTELLFPVLQVDTIWSRHYSK